MKKYLYIFITLLWVIGCADDDGNYSYSIVNEIGIDSIKETYTIDQFDILEIEPYLSFKTGKNIEDLSFEWKVNNHVISTSRICDGMITEEPSPSGSAGYTAFLCVTDNVTNLKYYKSFYVKVGTAYTNALYILSENAEGYAKLSMQRRDRKNAPLIHDVFETANPLLGSLSKQPRQVYYYNNNFVILCAEGDRKMVAMDPKTMKLERIYGEGIIKGEYSGTFTPKSMKLYMGGMIAAEEGLFGYNYMSNQALMRPVAGNHDFAAWADGNMQMDAYMWVTYDNTNYQFVRLHNGSGALYDEIVPITTDKFSTVGQKFLTAGHFGYEELRPVLYNAEEKKAYFYRLLMTADEWDMVTFLPIWEFSYEKIMERENLMDENSISVLGMNSLYWFIANGNKIVRMHGDGGEIRDLFTVPNGEIVDMLLDAKEERLFVASSDGVNSWVYVLSTLVNDFGAQKEEPLQMSGKIVSMTATGRWSY
ncbi:PKD-like family lipoprotein [uncultured Butyricimonas sp.]|uniref:PKD-like family lipoprotein n=1 Tax=uncultured Butyricimonas sp. TaxID=1268785 RepID=UPI00259382CC|nr:PKD-like family lipoprotein [uncultured Butyricimonas sp.]